MTCASVLALLAAGSAAEARPLGNSGTTAAPLIASDAATAAAQQTAIIEKQTRSSLAQAAAALQALQNAQTTAHALAIRSGSNSLQVGLPAVTDGLSPGGLIVDPRVPRDLSNPQPADDINLWLNASLPVSTTLSNGATSVVIHQSSQYAVMTWLQYNIGRNTLLTYDQQGNTNWVALNRIDATGNPSQILGSIKADGTVLLINPNGIIFGGSSQVNVHTLIATSLDVDNDSNTSVFLITGTGYTPTYNLKTVNGATFQVPVNEDMANQGFTQNGLFTRAGTNATSFSAIFSLGNQTAGAITVQPGALITTTTTSTGDGGYVALLGTSATNAGSISSPNGQIILAAGSNIVLSEPLSTAAGVQTALVVTAVAPAPSASASVVVGSNTDYISIPLTTSPNLNGGGSVTNDVSGLLTSSDGAVTLVGDSIKQFAGISVSTSLTRTGSIQLSTTANTTDSNGSGNIILGPGSLTAILPDETSPTIPKSTATAKTTTSSGTTTTYFQSTLQPQITIQASGSVDVQSGATIKAPSAAVSVEAGLTGTVLLETGSNIDLSGLTATLPVSTNILSILITPAEVADSPLAKNLIGQTVVVDARVQDIVNGVVVWVGSPLLDISGYVSTIPETLDQVLSVGGSLTIGNSVTNTNGVRNFIQQPGAVINVSGGFVAYTGGTIKTTQLIGADGRRYDIGDATLPTQSYAINLGFTVQHPHWGVTEIFAPLLSPSHYEPDYVDGSNAGSVTIYAAAPILEGSLVGDIVIGTRQFAGLDQLNTGATLSINFTGNSAYNVVLEPTADAILNAGGDPYGLSSFSFGSNWAPTVINSVFPIFSDNLTAIGFNSIAIATGTTSPTNATLSMPSDATLTVQPGGTVNLGNVTTINGTINAPSGKIILSGASYGSAGTPMQDVIIGPHAVLNVAGLWVNDAGLSLSQMQGKNFINGGSVTITTALDSYSDSSKNVSIVSGTITSGTATTVLDGGGYSLLTATDVTRSIILSSGSLVDVSSGGYVASNGKLTYDKTSGLPSGTGGSLTLQTYTGNTFNAADVGTVANNSIVKLANGQTLGPGTIISYQSSSSAINLPVLPTDGVFSANVVMNGSIRAAGFDGGGTLTLQAPSITIDGTATQITSYRDRAPNSGELVLPASFFTGNAFSQYTLTGVIGNVTVTANTTINLQQSNYLAPVATASIPTGAAIRDYAAIGLAPDAFRKPASLTLVLSGSYSAAGILIDSGATINVEEGAAVSLVGSAETVLGNIKAPGGAINVLSLTSGPVQDIWIGSTATLDVSGVFVPGSGIPGYSTGTAQPGGTITLDGPTVVVQAGANLDLTGTAATIQVLQGGLTGSRVVAQPVWSNGGALQLAGGRIYFAGTVDARGGVDPNTRLVSARLASGGTLTIGNVPVPNSASSYVNSKDGVTGNLDGPNNFVFVQSGNNVAATFTAPPQTAAALNAMQPTALGLISVDTLNNSGFDSVSVTVGVASSNTTGYGIGFSGSMTISVPDSLTLNSNDGTFTLLKAGVVNLAGTGSTGGAVVNLDASYIRLVGRNTSSATAVKLVANDGTFNVGNANPNLGPITQWIDLQRKIVLVNAANATFTSAGAIRLLPDLYGYPANSTYAQSPSLTSFGGDLIMLGNLTLNAAEIYPVSDTGFLIQAQGNSTLTIGQTGVASAPLSAGGAIVLDAQTIVQGGTLWAPLGDIVIGLTSGSQIPAAVVQPISDGASTYSGTVITTTSVTLQPGSVSSVSAAGLDVPYGVTFDGANWSLGLTTSLPAALSAAPAKSISLYASKITTGKGAVIDLSGGGDIYATEFIQGNGGNNNVLTAGAANQTVYALVPSATAAVAAYDEEFAIAYNSTAGLSGASIAIAAGSGIPAGTYVLMPGMYATVPGAYRVVTVNPNFSSTVPVHFTGADGSQYVTGTSTNALTGKRSSQTSLFQIQSAAVWTQSSQIKITSGTSYFRNQALAAGNVLPALPIDGGTLTLVATSSLTLNATNRFAAGFSDLAPGLGGVVGTVAISAKNILVQASDCAVSSSCSANQTTYLVLDADQISNLGAGTVLIGGTIATSTNGVQITPVAQNLEVDTDYNHQLKGSELILVSVAGGNGITVDAGSWITASGQASAASPTFNIGSTSPNVSGDGSLLRVANGGAANIVRSNLPATTAGNIAIGTNVGKTTLLTGAQVSISGISLNIDGSGNATLAPGLTSADISVNAPLHAQNYVFSAGQINIGGGNTGLVLSPNLLASFAGANSVTLRSGSVINLFDNPNSLIIGSATNPIGLLTFDSAGLYDQGGTTTITAANIDLINSKSVTGISTFYATNGKLNLIATQTITEDQGTKALGGFDGSLGAINWTAGQAIIFNGTGSIAAVGPVTSINVVSQGGGYTSVPTVNLGDGVQAKATASLGVATISVTAGGTGYQNGDAVKVTGANSSFQGTAIVDASGAIIGVNITQEGSGYTGTLTVSVTSAHGSGASLKASLGVVSITVTQSAGALTLPAGVLGYGFTPTSTVTFSGGGGTGATAQLLVGANAAMTLSAPALVVNGQVPVPLTTSTFQSTVQSLGTNGTLTILSAGGTAPAPVNTNFGGALNLTAASISLGTQIQALSGNVKLEATSGDVTLYASGVISAKGSTFAVTPDVYEYAPGGTVQLISDTGNVTINQGATVDVSGSGLGFAGSLAITTGSGGTSGIATLNGTLLGQAAYPDIGGSFTLLAGALANPLPQATMQPLDAAQGFSRNFSVTLGTVLSPNATNDINIDQGLVSGNVSLTANGGIVKVDGTINASGPSGGSIALYGAGGVTINADAVLRARYQADDPSDPLFANGTSAAVQRGGTITLGTTGTTDGTTNGTYGYENVPSSGAITVLSGAILDVSGGPGGSAASGIDNRSGSVVIRAPIRNHNVNNPSLNNTVNVSFNGVVVAGSVVLNAYAVWSTTDTSTPGILHFDGIIDPAGVNSSTDDVKFYTQTLVSFVHAAGGVVGTLLQINPEIDLVNPSSSINQGNIAVLSNWNLGGTASPAAVTTAATYQPAYRTAKGNPGVLVLRAVNNIAINATISDGFFETSDVFGGANVANQIANNQSGLDVNPTSAAGLMSVIQGTNNGSFSFDFVAGAANVGSSGAAPSVNPDAVIASAQVFPTITNGVDPTTNGQIANSITINGHTSYADALSPSQKLTIDIPTLVRTGTGSIRMTAGGYVAFLDQVAPGAVYTAGYAVSTPSYFNAPVSTPQYLANPNGLVSDPTWAVGGGSLTISALQSIIGIETPVDANGTQTGVKNAPTGQFWSDWYEHYGSSNGSSNPFSSCAVACQTAAWVNYATFFQGFGALGGGNITLTAGQNITDVSASLPETLLVSGGLTASHPPMLYSYGGGNLLVQAGGNLNSGDFLVGMGSGLIMVGGLVQADPANPVTGQPTGVSISGAVTPLSLLLAVQDGFLAVNARGTISLFNVYDPASLPLDAMVQTGSGYLPGANGSGDLLLGNPFTSFAADSGVALNSTIGTVSAFINGSSGTGIEQSLFVQSTGRLLLGTINTFNVGVLLPATLDLTALRGQITVNDYGVGNYGNLNLVPFYPTVPGGDTGNIDIVAAQSIAINGALAMPDLVTGPGQRLGSSAVNMSNYISPLGVALPNLTLALHANDPQPVVLAAGMDITVSLGLAASGSISLIKPALIEAGRNITIPTFTGQNNNADDITAVIAGNTIQGYSIVSGNYTATGTYYLYGPGDWLFQAGHDIGPFQPSINETSKGTNPGTAFNGVMAVGDGSNNQTGSQIGLSAWAVKPYLPHQSANITFLFGVGLGIGYADFINDYINPANAAAYGVSTQFAQAFNVSTAAGFGLFQQQSLARQHLIADKFFLEFLTQVETDYSNSSSPYFGQYARAYQATSTLFPASLGYSNDNSSGSGNGAATQIVTGQLDLANSLLETQMGGDINILGPGGGLTVGSSSQALAKNNQQLKQNQQGILTLAGGTIRAFTDGSILLNQSRIMTEQGGDIDLFSANGNINAGEGPKTDISSPAYSRICDQSGVCHINAAGLVTGSGIAALVTLPGQDPTKSNVSLAAPHGTIDLGSAGLRAAGSVQIVAVQVLNAYNVQVGGVAIGIPTTPTLPTTLSLPTTTTAVQTAPPVTQAEKRPSVIIVEILGFGGSDTPDKKDDCKPGEECRPKP